MKTIWKFTLAITDEQMIEMPQGAEILHVGQQFPGDTRSLNVWAVVDPNAPRVERCFGIVGTGNPFIDGPKFVGTVITNGGQLVWHVFDHGEASEIHPRYGRYG